MRTESRTVFVCSRQAERKAFSEPLGWRLTQPALFLCAEKTHIVGVKAAEAEADKENI